MPTSVMNSNHIDGIAADVEVGQDNQIVAIAYARKIVGPVGGVGYMKYKSIVHVDLGKPREF
jgi:uncharacterized protein YcbK (DUF882 family)